MPDAVRPWRSEQPARTAMVTSQPRIEPALQIVQLAGPWVFWCFVTQPDNATFSVAGEDVGVVELEND